MKFLNWKERPRVKMFWYLGDTADKRYRKFKELNVTPCAFYFVEIFHFLKIHFVYILFTSLERIGIFLIKLCSFDPSLLDFKYFNGNTLRSLYFSISIQFKSAAHAQITVTHNYVLLTNLLTWYEFETYY